MLRSAAAELSFDLQEEGGVIRISPPIILPEGDQRMPLETVSRRRKELI